MRHNLLTQCALFLHWSKLLIGVKAQKGHAESAFHDACRTSSGYFQDLSRESWGWGWALCNRRKRLNKLYSSKANNN